MRDEYAFSKCVCLVLSRTSRNIEFITIIRDNRQISDVIIFRTTSRESSIEDLFPA